MPALRHASLKWFPKDSFVSGPPLAPQTNAISPVGPASRTSISGVSNRMETGVSVFFGPQRRYAPPHMLTTKLHRVAATQPRVEQHGKPDPLPRAELPRRAVLGYVVVRPDREALAVFKDRYLTLAAGSTLRNPASLAHAQSPRRVSRKCRA